jgi:RNA polymerase sigma-70 factor, ECF subfamily
MTPVAILLVSEMITTKNGELASLGEEAVSDAFIREHYPGLSALLRRRIGDANVAAEILNEAMAKAIEHSRKGRIAQPELLAGYVFRVALNLYRNHRREFDNRPDLRAASNDIQQLASNANDGDELEAGVVRKIRDIVRSLPTARDREIVKRFYLDEEDKDDICQSLGLSHLQFDKVIFRARQRLRSLLEQRGFRKADFFALVLMVFLA